jgi:hypothetical protein
MRKRYGSGEQGKDEWKGRKVGQRRVIGVERRPRNAKQKFGKPPNAGTVGYFRARGPISRRMLERG